jgi:hypothetical protein
MKWPGSEAKLEGENRSDVECPWLGLNQSKRNNARSNNQDGITRTLTMVHLRFASGHPGQK